MNHLRLVPAVPATFAAANVSVAGAGCIAVARLLTHILEQDVEEPAPTPADARGSHVRLTPEGSLDTGVVTRLDPTSPHDEHELVRAREIVARQLRIGGPLVMNARIPAAAVTYDPALVHAHLRLVLFAADPADLALRAHLERGGLGFAVHQGWITEHEHGDFHAVLRITDVRGVGVEDLLAIVAAARARGIPRATIVSALSASVARPA